MSLHGHLSEAACSDKDNSGIKHRLNNICKQVLHNMAAGLLAGTSYWWTNDSCRLDQNVEFTDASMQFSDLIEYFFYGYLNDYITIVQAEVLMDMVQGAERCLGADHILTRCVLNQIYGLLQRLQRSMHPNLQGQDVSDEDSATSLPAKGNDERVADEKEEGDAEEAESADAGSEVESGASIASAKHAMACTAASLGYDIAARQQPKHDTDAELKHDSDAELEQDADAEPEQDTSLQDEFQQYLVFFGKPCVHQANLK